MPTPIRPIVMPKWGLAMQEGMVAQLAGRGGRRDQRRRRDPRHRDVQDRQRVREPGRRAAAPDRWSARARPCRSARCSAWSPTPRCPTPSSTPSSPSSRRSSPPTPRRPAPRRPSRRRSRPAAGASATWRSGEGEGTPIVLIHGFGGDLNNWQFNQEALAAGRPTYAIDLPGHGGSSKELGAGHVHVGALARRGGRFHGREGHRQGASGRPFARRRDRPGSGAQPRRPGRLGDR